MSKYPSRSIPPAQSSELQDRVAAAFVKLAASATELNAVSDELSKSIHAIDEVLKKLNLGVSTWKKFAETTNPVTFWSRSIGYARVSARWGLAIRADYGCYDDPESEQEEVWRFNDAPRSYRLEALAKLPELLDQLAETSGKVAGQLKERVALTRQVAVTLSQMASSDRSSRKRST